MNNSRIKDLNKKGEKRVLFAQKKFLVEKVEKGVKIEEKNCC